MLSHKKWFLISNVSIKTIDIYKKVSFGLLVVGLLSISAMPGNVSADASRVPHQIVGINLTPKGVEFSNFVSIGSTLYFITSDDTTPWGLWKSDGTDAGTVLVRAIEGTSESITEPSLTVLVDAAAPAGLTTGSGISVTSSSAVTSTKKLTIKVQKLLC